jgi:hypothetical protein
MGDLLPCDILAVKVKPNDPLNTIVVLLKIYERDKIDSEYSSWMNMHFYRNLGKDLNLLDPEESLEGLKIKSNDSLVAVLDRKYPIFKDVKPVEIFGNVWKIESVFILKGEYFFILCSWPKFYTFQELTACASHPRRSNLKIHLLKRTTQSTLVESSRRWIGHVILNQNP